MKKTNDPSSTSDHLVKGLPMFTASAPEIIAKEKADLQALADKPPLQRWRGYFAKTGPGWLQSALVLGSGSAMASLFAGAFLQYRLLWVQPLAMGLGIVMFWAMAYQTLSTGVRPFHAMKRYIHPVVAWIVALIIFGRSRRSNRWAAGKGATETSPKQSGH